MKSTEKGNIGLFAVQKEAALKGYYVGLMPEGCPYDLVIDKKDNKIYRIQVKYSQLLSGTIRVECNSGSKIDYNTKNIDAIVCYCPDTDKCYWIEANDVETKKETIHLRVNEAKQNHKTIRWAKNYEKW